MIRTASFREVQPFYPACLDIETDPDGAVIGVGFAPWAGEYHAFENFTEWTAYFFDLYAASDADRRKALRSIYAHNGASFDWLALVVYWLEAGILKDASVLLAGTRPLGITARVRYGKTECTLKLRDSLLLIPGRLSALTAAFGVEHEKIKLGCLPHELKATDPAAFWYYLKNDVLGLQEVLFRFWGEIHAEFGSIGTLPLTIAALAMRVFQTMLTRPQLVPTYPRAKELARAAYKGGRVEVFAHGKFDGVRVYDYNSLYPSVMYDFPYPECHAAVWVSAYRGAPGIYRVRYEQTDRTRPPLLLDHETGEYRYRGAGVYCHPELDALLAMGGQFEFIEGYEIPVTGFYFRRYVERLWGLRLAAQRRGDRARDLIYKLLLNSLYGKFGQRGIGHKLILNTEENCDKLLAAGARFYVHGFFLLVEEQNPVEHEFAAIAAYVTCYGRLRLYAAIERAAAAGGQVVYVDTDSVHVVGGAPLQVSDALGALKLERAGVGVYVGRKLYRVDNVVRAKGVRIDDEKGVTYIDKLLDGATIEVAFRSFPTATGVLERGEQPCKLQTRKRTIRQTR